MNQVVFVMDAIEDIKPVKDTSFALMLEAQRRGHAVWYANEGDLALEGSACTASIKRLEVVDRERDFFRVTESTRRALGAGDLVFMRSDSLVDDSYIYTTLLLDRVDAAGGRVVNRPDALRGFNEKLALARFPKWAPETLVSADMAALREFVDARERAVIKPLDGMGGRGIFVLSSDDPNLPVILETLTDQGRQLAMIQQFLPGIEDGDKRVLMVAGEPVPFMLARIPGGKDFRGNLARGGRGEGRPLTDAERAIAAEVGPVLVENGIEFAGLDVIDGRLTEINVTSPTCVRELDAQFDLNIAGQLFDALER